MAENPTDGMLPADEESFDFPSARTAGVIVIGSIQVEDTFLIGIACQSKKDPKLVRKELLDAGTLAISYRWRVVTDTSTVTATPNVQLKGQDVQGDLLQDGKWIEKMGHGAKVWELAVSA
jgi:hypothetical protein